MEPADLGKLALLILCLILSAFFSSSETAFIAFSRTRLLHLVNIGHARAKLVSRLLQNPERLLATVLLSNNLVNTAAAALGTALAISFIQNSTIAVLVSIFGVTSLLLVFSETLPKTIAWNQPERVAFAFARPLVLVQWTLTPVTRVLQGIAILFTKSFGMTRPASRVSEQEIRSLIAMGAETGGVEAAEAQLLERVFRFGDRQVMDVMTPRPEIVWIEQGTTFSQFLTVYLEHSHTRFPVYEGSIENAIGVLSNKDVILGLAKGGLKPDESVTDLLRPAYFVPETKSISSTFAEMQQEGHGLVLAVDEFGGIAGVATLEQLLEVIVGEVGEEGRAPEEGYVTIDENTFSLDAGIGIAEINEKLSLGLPEGDYQTVAGFLLDRLGFIPEEGASLEFESLRFTIKVMDGVRIERVEVKREEGAAGEDIP